MSLFGNPLGASVSQNNNRFSGFGAATTQPATAGGMFGTTGATQQPSQQPTGPVSLTGGSSQAPSRAGLFGVSSQPPQQAAGGGLFGGASAQQQAQTGGGNFGGTSQPPSYSSIFPSATSQPHPQSQSQTQQNAETSTYFDSILAKSRKRGLGETADADLPQLQLGLGDLRQRMKRFASGTPDKVIDGRAHYLLAASGVDPGAAVRDLNHFSSAAGRVERPQLQDASDTDVDGYLANLQTQTTLMISDGLARSVRDFDTFLEDNVTMEWDAQRKRIYQHFGIKQRQNVGTGNAGFAASESHGRFGRSRRSKAATLAGSRASGSGGGSTFGGSGLQKSVIGAAAPIGSTFQPLFSDIEKRMEANGIVAPDPNDRFHREKQGRLAEKVQKLNEARIQNRCFPILHELRRTIMEGGEEHSDPISKAFGAMVKIVGEPEEDVIPSDPLVVKERQFADAYLNDTPNSSQKGDIKKRIIRGSSQFLEGLFYGDMDAYIKKSPKEATLGGVPDVLNKVKAYVRLRAARKDLAPDNIDLQMLNEDYVWALVFFLIRSGHVKEAVEYVTTNAIAFRAIDRNFAAYITDYQSSREKRLRRELQDRINSEYNQRLRIAPENSIDPFRMACYKIIGRCDLRNRSLENGIQQSMEDYMWLQFILSREVNMREEHATEHCNLASVQAVIKEIGSRFFVKGDNYGTYFYMQVLGGLFEEAIEYLYPYSYPDAVHFAIALDYYGLLRVSNPESLGESSLLSFTTTDLPQIKFGHMVGHYTRDFRAANVTAAVDYLTLICLNRDLPGQLGLKQVVLCHDALRELVLESREFALLLGDIQHDGQRIEGIIETRMKLIALEEPGNFMRTITIQAASIADDNGRVTDAVLLYHLAEEYDNVVGILTRAMSEAVSVQIGQDQLPLQPLNPRAVANNQRNGLSLTSVDDPVILAGIIYELYKSNALYTSRIQTENLAAFDTLLQASKIKSCVQEGRWTLALDGIEELQILPIRVDGNPTLVRKCATKFASLSQPVAHIIPNLLMWAIICSKKEVAHLIQGPFEANGGTKGLMVDQLRQQNMDLTTYTSLLRFRFPAHVHEALARAQSE